MWSAGEWAIRNGPIARHDIWGQQFVQNNPWDYNIKIVPDEERPSPFSLPQSPPDYNAMQLLEKLVDLIKVITHSYPPLIL